MTVRESLADLKLSLILLALALGGLSAVTYVTFGGRHGGSHCLIFRATGTFCGSDRAAYWLVGAGFAVLCSLGASVLAVLEGLDAFREEKRVDYSFALVSLLPIAALIAITVAA